MRQNRIYSLEIDWIFRTRGVVAGVRLKSLQEIAYDVSGKTGHDVSENEQVVVEMAFLIVLEIKFQVFNTVQGSIG